MKKVIEVCTCDICGKEGAKEYKTLAYRYSNIYEKDINIIIQNAIEDWDYRGK